MIWACVPKTPIYEDRHAGRPEDYIRLAPKLRKGRNINPVPKSAPVQLAPQFQLDAGISPWQLLHLPPHRR